ncbi:hypothetical protein FRC01_004307 [Tulasnella sp. 417]|nr:hypothetical protein FRC01_004307 [Tulasnella sp. 417]
MARPNAFSVYASHFINTAANNINRSLYPESEVPERLFFSATDGGSHLADSKDSLPRDSIHPHHPAAETTEVDDDGYPRLTGSAGSALRATGEEEDSDNDQYGLPGPSSQQKPRAEKKPSDDPYLDDADLEEELDLHKNIDSIPLIASSSRSPPQAKPNSPPTRKAPAPGWLAHFSISRTQSPSKPPPSTRRAQPYQVDSPRSSGDEDSFSDSSLPTSHRTSEESDSSDPPAFLDERRPPPPFGRTTLQESLLPRDGVSRTLFNLPDPQRALPGRKYNDSVWTAIWCTSLLVCGLGSIIVLFVTVSPSKPSNPDKAPSPYSTITSAIPLLTTVVLLSSALSYAHLVLLRYAVRPILLSTGVAIPAALFVGAAWSFAGSFPSSSDPPQTWGETVGLRLFSIIPLALAVLSARSLYYRHKALLRTVAVVELSMGVVLENPPLLALSLCLLFAALVASIPFLSLILRLTLIGYYSKKPSDQSWHVRGYAGWLAFMATGVWIWSWAVVRGALRVAVSGVVGNWYFTRSEPEPARKPSMAVTEAAFARAHGASLGSICVATLVLTFTQSSIFILRNLRRITTPPQLQFLAPLHPFEWVASLIAILDSLSNQTLTYIGLTGEAFWSGSRKARELLSPGGKHAKGKVTKAMDYSLLSFLLTLSSLSISVVTAVGGFVYAAHSGAPTLNAALMALLTGGVTFMTINFALGLGRDAADALFVCYRLDIDAGVKNCPEAFEAFEGKPQTGEV